MNRSSLLFTTLSLCLLSTVVGCAAETKEETGAADSEIVSTAGLSLAGKYFDRSVPFAGIGRLNLEKDGTYTAHVEAGGRALCITSPCLVPQSGRWYATLQANGTFRLALLVGGDASLIFQAEKKPGQLVLTQGSKVQTLTTLEVNGCLDDSDCSATQECAPRMCLMYCAVDDVFCCGPSTCETKPTPPRSCVGAWLDQNGLCRTPADGVYPAECCEDKGETCGDAQCGAGEVCCNPLAGICTKPGMACAM